MMIMLATSKKCGRNQYCARWEGVNFGASAISRKVHEAPHRRGTSICATAHGSGTARPP